MSTIQNCSYHGSIHISAWVTCALFVITRSCDLMAGNFLFTLFTTPIASMNTQSMVESYRFLNRIFFNNLQTLRNKSVFR